MTDARFPERWLNDRRFRRLTAEAFRAFTFTMTWSVANRTDGLVTAEDLECIPFATKDLMAEMVDTKVLSATSDGWVILDFELTQTTAKQLAAADQSRLHEREKKRRQRTHNSGVHTLCTPDTCSHVPGDVPRDNRGQDRTETETGQAQLQEEDNRHVTSTFNCSWHMAEPGRPCENCGQEEAAS